MTETRTDRTDDIQWPASTLAGRARAEALDELDSMPQPDEWVEYKSLGRLLIIGSADDALPLAEVLKDHLDCSLLATSPPSEPPETAPAVRYLDGRPRDLIGYLGAFKLNVEVDRGRVLEAAAAFATESGIFDLVLDLDGSGGMRMDEPPPGYFLAVTEAGRQQALEELPEMVGEFQKPRFFAYDPEICAHGARGMAGCSNCLLACATEAIISVGDKIEVNPYLCQGCGSCTTVCPSGAIRYQAPASGDLIDAARRLLKTFREAADKVNDNAQVPELLLYSEGSAEEQLAEAASTLPEYVLPIAVEDVGAIGMETWFSALAFGAARVLLLPGPEPAPAKIEASKSMIRVAEQIFGALSDPHCAERIVWLENAADAASLEAVPPMATAPATFGGLGGKRELIRRALEALHEQASQPERCHGACAAGAVRRHRGRSRRLHDVHGLRVGLPGLRGSGRRRPAASSVSRGSLCSVRALRNSVSGRRHHAAAPDGFPGSSRSGAADTQRSADAPLSRLRQGVRDRTDDPAHDAAAQRSLDVSG